MAGCSTPMVYLYNVGNYQTIDRALSNEQIKESIIEGASNAGWVTQDLGNNNILATYHIRVHTITVNISYTESAYIASYKSSTSMKIACTTTDYSNGKYRVSGKNNCSENQPPKAIHGNYKTWVESLVASIERSLETK